LAKVWGGKDKWAIPAQNRCPKTEPGEPLRSNLKAKVGDWKVNAAVGGAIKQSADRNRRGTLSLISANQKIRGLPGREKADAKQNVLPLDIHLGSIENLGGGLGVIMNLANVRLYELAPHFTGDFAEEVGDEDKAILKDADAMQNAAIEILGNLTTQRGNSLA
jgi:hypothetical protein